MDFKKDLVDFKKDLLDFKKDLVDFKNEWLVKTVNGSACYR